MSMPPDASDKGNDNDTAQHSSFTFDCTQRNEFSKRNTNSYNGLPRSSKVLKYLRFKQITFHRSVKDACISFNITTISSYTKLFLKSQ